ncbi:hypothetical protein NIES2109_23000 [Nostoc sp. HK-01]|nr:hypothetical protein NIES2109_23000 [Nostoc sp. HK-01]
MTTLTGTFENGSVAVPGKLVLTLANGTVKDTAPKKIFLPKPIEILCPSGAIPGSTNIEETETKNTSYYLEYFPRISTSPDVFSDEQLSPFPFYTVIPNLASVDIADLVPTGYVSDVLSTGAVRIARVIASDPALAASIGGITPKGAYNISTSYKRGDVVSYLNRFFLASEVVPFSGIVPTNTAYWMEIPVAPTGSIALGDSTVYGASWNNSGLAPTQDAVYDILQSVQGTITLKANTTDAVLAGNPTTPTQATSDNSTRIASTAYVKSNLSSYAPIASPALTGTPTAPTPTAGNNTTQISTTAFIQSALSSYAPLSSPTFTGDPKAPTPVWGDSDTSISTTAFVRNYFTPVAQVEKTTSQNTGNNNFSTVDGGSVITFNSTIIDTDSTISGNSIILPSGRGGFYGIFMNLTIGTTSSASATHKHACYLRINRSGVDSFIQVFVNIVTAATGVTETFSPTLFRNLLAGDTLTLLSNSGTSASFSAHTVGSGSSFSIIRLY